jgi:hypothetical protein
MHKADTEGNLGAAIAVKLAYSAARAIAKKYVPLNGFGLEMSVDEGSDHISPSG